MPLSQELSQAFMALESSLRSLAEAPVHSCWRICDGPSPGASHRCQGRGGQNSYSSSHQTIPMVRVIAGGILSFIVKRAVMGIAILPQLVNKSKLGISPVIRASSVYFRSRLNLGKLTKLKTNSMILERHISW